MLADRGPDRGAPGPRPRLPYVAAVREDVAVGLAAGAWLGGKRPAVLHAELRTRHEPQRPGLAGPDVWAAVAADRGPGGATAARTRPSTSSWARSRPAPRPPRHPHRVASAGSLEADLAWAVAEMDARMHPVALLVPPGVVETGRAHGAAPAAPSPIRHRCRGTPTTAGAGHDLAVGRARRRRQAARRRAPDPRQRLHLPRVVLARRPPPEFLHDRLDGARPGDRARPRAGPPARPRRRRRRRWQLSS